MRDHDPMPHDDAHGTARVRDFFAVRAAGWDARFPDDGPAFAAAVGELGLHGGEAVLDAGCGTGRALPALRAAVGPDGTLLAADLTPEMLSAAAEAGRSALAHLLCADVNRMPLSGGVLDAVFAAGLISHLPDPVQGLRELARVVRPHGTLALFHPVGRAALAARQSRTLTADDVRAECNLRGLLETSGWRLRSCADEDERYLAIASRTP
jgi:SAM-dependent methyltransferase